MNLKTWLSLECVPICAFLEVNLHLILMYIYYIMNISQKLRDCGIRLDDPRVHGMIQNVTKLSNVCSKDDIANSQVLLDQTTFKRFFLYYFICF